MTAARAPYVRRRYWNEARMNWVERLYLPEVLRGLAITSRVFLVNMGRWTTGRKGALTTYYPEEKRRDYAAGYRGKHVLTQRRDRPGAPQCTACNLCATVCPAKVIEIDAAFDPDDPVHPKSPARFEIDYARCVFCGLCIEACPEDAIRMVPEVPDFPSGDRWRMWIGRESLLTWQPHSDAAKPYRSKNPPLQGEGKGGDGPPSLRRAATHEPPLPFKGRGGGGDGFPRQSTEPIPLPTSPLKGEEGAPR